MSNVIFGIDVSEHNGLINWDKVKESGKVGFAMLRAGYGKGVIDKQFHRNASECNRLDIPIGVYWFSYAKNAKEAENEAEYCLSAISGSTFSHRIDYPVAFDFEDDSVKNCQKCGISIVGKDFATSLALNFLSVIKRAGYKAAIYTNPAYLNQYFDIGRLSDYDLWLAQWPLNPNPEKRPYNNPHIWQYSSMGNVPGISAPVDMNVCYVDYLPKEELKTMSTVMDQPWAQNAVEKAKEYGISDGSRPLDVATRVEVMAMIVRAFEFFRGSHIALEGYVDERIDQCRNACKVVEAVDDVIKATGFGEYIKTQDDGK